MNADFSFLTTASVCFDAVYIPGGVKSSATLMAQPEAIHFVDEAFKHCKALCATADGQSFLKATAAGDASEDAAVILGKKQSSAAAGFVNAIAQHRNWDREKI